MSLDKRKPEFKEILPYPDENPELHAGKKQIAQLIVSALKQAHVVYVDTTDISGIPVHVEKWTGFEPNDPLYLQLNGLLKAVAKAHGAKSYIRHRRGKPHTTIQTIGINMGDGWVAASFKEVCEYLENKFEL